MSDWKYQLQPQIVLTLVGFIMVLSLAGCTTKSSNNCAGWSGIALKSETAVYLAGNDTKAGKAVAGHNAYGKKAGGW